QHTIARRIRTTPAALYYHDGARAALGSASSTSPAPNRTPMMEALQEAEDAITNALDQGHAVDLAPQNSYVRRLQHRLAERYNLSSRSRGKEPNRHVRIFPAGTPRRPD